jgi:hypothetical protein
LSLPIQGQVIATWTNSTGNWSNPANWSTNPKVPNNGTGTTYSVTINAPTFFVDMDVLNVTIDNVTVGDGSFFSVRPGDSLSLVSGTSSNSGSFGNQGTLLNLGAFTNQSGAVFSNESSFTNSGTFTNDVGGIITTLPGATITNTGTLVNFGEYSESSILNNSGTLTNMAGASLQIASDGGVIINTGTISNYGSLGDANGMANGSGAFFKNYGSFGMDTASVLANSGTVLNAAGATFDQNVDFSEVINNGTFTNKGTFNNTTSLLTNTGTFTNNGTLTNDYGNETFPTLFGTIDNSGTFRNNGTIINAGTINNTGVFRNSGVLNITSTGLFTTSTNYTQTAGSTQVDGTFTATGGAIMNIKGGVLSGTGTINGNVLMGGTMMPGDAPGTLTIFGDYEQTSKGTFDELLSSSSHSFLDVNGKAVLDHGSVLEISLLNGFNPITQTFEIMDYSSLTGTFANGSSFWDDGFLWDVSYGPNQIDITAVQAPEPGTFDLLKVGLIGLVVFCWYSRSRLLRHNPADSSRP